MDALTLISEPTGWLDPHDQQRDRFFLHRLQKQDQQAQQIAKKIPSQGKIDAIAQQFSGGEMALSLLHSAGHLAWLDPFHYQLNLHKSGAFFPQFNSQQQSQLLMRRYLMTRQCRWQFLLNAFGFTQEATGFRCGHCDNCR
jgi:ATP-dependent DNA helicase RecQ